MDPKNMSLDDLIKRDKTMKKGGAASKLGGRGGRRARGGKAAAQGRGRFGSGEARGGRKDLRAKRTGNMIGKRGGARGGKFKAGATTERRYSDERRAKPQRRPVSAGSFRGGKRVATTESRGGLARGGRRAALAAPKRQRQLRVGSADKSQTIKTKMLRPSDVRLKVRNIDEKQVTNDDLKKLFHKIGELKVCRFDRNEFGQFLGSATVTYENPEDAKQAISEYHGAFLDDKVLTVEYDMVPQVTKFVKPSSAAAGGGRTLSLKKGPGAGKTLRLK